MITCQIPFWVANSPYVYIYLVHIKFTQQLSLINLLYHHTLHPSCFSFSV